MPVILHPEDYDLWLGEDARKRDLLAEPLGCARGKRVAIMCSEAVWWRCHRALVADYLKAEGVNVCHIMSEAAAKPHPYTSAAKVVDNKLSYRE